MQTNLTNFEQTHASPSPRLTYIVDPENKGVEDEFPPKICDIEGLWFMLIYWRVRGMEVFLIQNL